MTWQEAFAKRAAVSPDILMVRVDANGKLLDSLPPVVNMLLSMAGMLFNKGLIDILCLQVVWCKGWFGIKWPTLIALANPAANPALVGSDGILLGLWEGPAGNRAAFTQRIVNGILNAPTFPMPVADPTQAVE